MSPGLKCVHLGVCSPWVSTSALSIPHAEMCSPSPCVNSAWPPRFWMWRGNEIPGLGDVAHLPGHLTLSASARLLRGMLSDTLQRTAVGKYKRPHAFIYAPCVCVSECFCVVTHAEIWWWTRGVKAKGLCPHKDRRISLGEFKECRIQIHHLTGGRDAFLLTCDHLLPSYQQKHLLTERHPSLRSLIKPQVPSHRRFLKHNGKKWERSSL